MLSAALDDKGVKSVTQINNVCLRGWKTWHDGLHNFSIRDAVRAKREKSKKGKLKGSMKCQAGAQQFLFSRTPFGTVDEPFFPRSSWSSLKEAKWDFHVELELRAEDDDILSCCVCVCRETAELL